MKSRTNDAPNKTRRPPKSYPGRGAAIAALVAGAIAPFPVAAEANCRETDGYILCLDDGWLRHYSEPGGDIDWGNYLEPAPEAIAAPEEIEVLYQDILARSPLPSEREAILERLEGGLELNELRRELARSDEARRILNEVYNLFLGRDMDEGGWQTWSEALAEGAKLTDVVREIRTSSEAIEYRQNREEVPAEPQSRAFHFFGPFFG